VLTPSRAVHTLHHPRLLRAQAPHGALLPRQTLVRVSSDFRLLSMSAAFFFGEGVWIAHRRHSTLARSSFLRRCVLVLQRRVLSGNPEFFFTVRTDVRA
jgi:hypothetical protein